MRGRVPGGGGRGGRGARDLSALAASTNMRDSRSDWHHDRFDRRPYRISSSPPRRDRNRLSPVPRSTSMERQDYALRRLDYEKRFHEESPPLPQRHGPSLPFQHDDYDLAHRYMLTGDPSNLNPEVNSNVKLSRANKEFLPPGNGAPATSSSGLETLSTLHQQRLFLDDGSSRTFYSLSSDANYSADAALLKPEKTGRIRGLLDVGYHDYHDQLRSPYDERHGGKVYTKDASFTPLARSYVGATSSNLPKTDLPSLYDDHLRHPHEGLNRDGPTKFLDDTLDRVEYGKMQLPETMRRGSPSRIDPQYYGYDEYSQRENNSRGYIGSDGMYEKLPWGSRSDHCDKIGSSIREMVGVRIRDLDTSQDHTSESNLWNKYRSLHGDASLEYRELKGINADYVDFVDNSTNEHLGYRMKPSRVHELTSEEERYALGPGSVSSYKERPTNHLHFDPRMDIYGETRSLRGESEIDDVYRFSSERMTRRKYVSDSYISEHEPRTVASNDRAAYRTTDDIWPEEEWQGTVHSKRMALGHTKYKQISHRVPTSDVRLSSGGTFRQEKHGHGMNIKRRLRPGPSESHGPYNPDRRKENFRPYKHRKRDRHDSLILDEHAPDNSDKQTKVDPPEGSEEFKQQVHKAFLRFFKVLNENPQELKRYREQGQGSSLQCLVCGSSAEYKATHDLVSHLYRSGKVGLKTEHLGLHKALCLVVGWNWLVAPDNSKAYQSAPASDAKSLKEDLILWPPVIIIHNSSIEKKMVKGEQKSLSIESVQEIIKELGFEASKTTIGQGKPANRSVFLIKFFPTFSGLQEAERLHKRFANNHRGKKEFQKRAANKSIAGNTTLACFKKFPSLYGYMAVAEDLPKLDPETMKRCLVKSKKDIEAIADAPLNLNVD